VTGASRFAKATSAERRMSAVGSYGNRYPRSRNAGIAASVGAKSPPSTTVISAEDAGRRNSSGSLDGTSGL
jgi:hypothetical protein